MKKTEMEIKIGMLDELFGAGHTEEDVIHYQDCGYLTHNKAYFFPDDEYCDAFFGGETPCCVDEDEVRRLADDWGMPFDELLSQMHTASADEIREYGV